MTRRLAVAVTVLIAGAALALPGFYVWCVSPTGHGALENLLLGHGPADADHCGRPPAPIGLSCSGAACDHQACTSCTDIPVEFPLVFSWAPDVPELEPACQGSVLGDNQPALQPWPGGPAPDGGESQRLLCLAATVILC